MFLTVDAQTMDQHHSYHHFRLLLLRLTPRKGVEELLHINSGVCPMLRVPAVSRVYLGLGVHQENSVMSRGGEFRRSNPCVRSWDEDSHRGQVRTRDEC